MKFPKRDLFGWIRFGCWFGLLIAGLATARATPQAVYSVDSILALKSVSHSAYQYVEVTGYNTARDGGGGFYAYVPGDTSSPDNKGTMIVSTIDGGRWALCQAEPPTIQQFGAVNGALSDNSVAINYALQASCVVRVPPGVYRCDYPIKLYNYSVLVGEGVQGEAADTTLTSAPKFVFYGGSSAVACFMNADETNTLVCAALFNLAITTDAYAAYGWMIKFTGPTAVDLKNIRAETASLVTGGIQYTKLAPTECAPNPPASWVHHWYNVQINLPAWSGSGAPPSATQYAADLEISDSQLVGGYINGGKGAFFHGSGVFNCSNVRFAGSCGYALTLSHDKAANSPTADGFMNCIFEAPYVGAIQITNDTITNRPDSSPRFVGNTFITPGMTGVPISYGTAAVPVRGGTFLNNSFISNPVETFSLNGQGVGWTIAHNKYATTPDFSGLTQASIDEDAYTAAPQAARGHGTRVIDQKAAPSLATIPTGTPALTEVTLATIKVPANTLVHNGKLRISATFAVTGDDGKVIRIRFGSGANNPAFYQQTLGATGSTNMIHVLREISMASSSTSAEVGAEALGNPGPGMDSVSVVTGTVSGTVDQNVTLTGEFNAVDASDSVTLQQYTVELLTP